MYEIVRRAFNALPELTAELWRRGMFLPDEKAELLRCHPEHSEESRHTPLGTVQFATLRNMLGQEELTWLNRLLRFQKPNEKRDELTRIVERAMEGRKGNAGRGH
jgi:hypothetical protein